VVSHDLKLERLVDASPAVVFGEFTGLQAQKELYADAPGWIVESQCDLQLGAVRRPCSGLREPRPLAFQVIDWPRCLVYRSTMTMPDGSSVDTRIEATFREHDGRTG